LVYEYEGGGEDIVLENNYLSLRFLPDSAEIILTDKITGARWYSNPPGASDDPMADPVTKDLMRSQLAIEYADVSGVGMTLASSLYSVDRKAFEYEVVNNVLEVRYTVGDIAPNYRIPPAATEERMWQFLDKMDFQDQKEVETNYRLYDINNLRSTDNKEKLLSDFPELTERKLYILRVDTPDFLKEDMERWFKEAGYTSEDYFEDVALYPLAGNENKPAFNITLCYSLEGKSLVLNVPYEKIIYRPSFPITQLHLMPYFGAGNTNDTGYMLVPDGSGGLIHFNNGKQNQIPYSISIYGWDEAMPREFIISDNKALFPAFGVQKNGAALFCIIEEGSAYASVRSGVSRFNSSWNNVYPVFDVVHRAMMDIAGRSERAVYLYERGLPANENITLRYTMCEKPGYVGMADEYRSWLLNRYPAIGNRQIQEGVPVAVEIIGAVNKTQHRLGLPLDLPLRLTSYRETAAIIDDLAGFGWKNVNVKLNGWFNRSVDHGVPTKIKLISELGSKRDFERIVSAAKNNNFELYPEADFFFMKDVKMGSGFSLYKDAARYVSRKRIQKYPFSFVWFGERTSWGKLSYVARPEVSMKLIDNYIHHNNKNYGIQNVAFRNMASRLAGDYNEKRHVSREASMKIRQEKFEQLDQNGNKMLINTGFVYAAPWASLIIDMILEDQAFGITDDSVPFLPIVLHGLVPYTGRAINLAEDYTKNLLRTIESGAGLYFSFMTEETAVLQETKFRQFYANEYAKWAGDANAMYREFTDNFGHLYNQAITDHAILKTGVTITTYEDGTRILVNATDFAFDYNGRNLDADSYAVLRRGE
jgi:hypothetical protein